MQRLSAEVVVEQKEDAELKAMATLLSVLEPLSETARESVIAYVFRRLGIKSAPESQPHAPLVGTGAHEQAAAEVHSPQIKQHAVADIRQLKERKQPSTASEMVALTAYYLEHLAPAEQRRAYITADDIKLFFLQADFPLPKAAPATTLVNAKNAGYLDSAARGQYRLNPVGHNLVAHKLPSTLQKSNSAKTRRASSVPQKTAKKLRKA
jgi:hypothetical protein